MQAEARSALAARLRVRRGEIERAAFARSTQIELPPEPADPEYLDGLRQAVGAAIDFGIASIAEGGEASPDPPQQLLAQARLAARCGVGLETVLRRYFCGFTLFSEFVLQEAESGLSIPDTDLRALWMSTSQFDGLVTAVSKEYRSACEAQTSDLSRRRSARVEKLLRGEPVDLSDLGYELEGRHIAVIASGEDVSEVLRGLRRAIDARLLQLDRGDGVVWAWLGRRNHILSSEVKAYLLANAAADVHSALGEPGGGREGWRLTHRQARAAWAVALRAGSACVRYIEAVLPAAALQDEVLAASLHDLYIRPLAANRDGGKALKETLRAYFAAVGNTSSAAAALGVSRQTVINRIHTTEKLLDRHIEDCAPELLTALKFDELSSW